MRVLVVPHKSSEHIHVAQVEQSGWFTEIKELLEWDVGEELTYDNQTVPQIDVIVDEEAKFGEGDRPTNHRATQMMRSKNRLREGDFIAGDAVFVAIDLRLGNAVSLPDSFIEEVSQEYYIDSSTLVVDLGDLN